MSVSVSVSPGLAQHPPELALPADCGAGGQGGLGAAVAAAPLQLREERRRVPAAVQPPALSTLSHRSCYLKYVPIKSYRLGRDSTN